MNRKCKTVIVCTAMVLFLCPSAFATEPPPPAVTDGKSADETSALSESTAADTSFLNGATANKLESVSGQGFISRLTPEEIEKISGRGMVPPEMIEQKTKHLTRVTDQDVTYVVDTNRIPNAELEKITGRGTIQDIGRSPFSVQVGVFKVRENALAMLRELEGKGYEPYIFQTIGDEGGKLFAVRIGDYDDVKDAYAAVTHFKSKEKKPAVVTYINSLKTVQKEDVTDTTEAKTETPPQLSAGDFTDKGMNALYQELAALRKEVEQIKAEAEARENLRMTEAEEEKKEEDILSAAGREYTMAKKGTLTFDYTFGYTFNTYEQVSQASTATSTATYQVNHVNAHTLRNSIASGYSLMDNLKVTASVPFLYKYQELGRSGSKDVSDIGDISLGANWQPVKTGGKLPATILTTNINIPTGRSPYEINNDTDISTGSGVYSATVGFTASKTVDPIVAYGGMGYTHSFEETGLNQNLSSGRVLTSVEPKGIISASMGIGYAMSYKVSIHTSFSYSYLFGATYKYDDGSDASTGNSATASLVLGTGWKVSPKRTISINLGLGLTNDASDFAFSFRIPFDFET
ncbi:MAG: SPOR domain-containing protein [Thermodesulfobacteriota bacterium]|nr:SPOR domain-containing protein [Thermodesulfobacteriota bacterium]